MIHYNLRCEAGHDFDGWFRSGAAFDEQAARHLLECPTCGSATVTRALMAPAVPRKGARPSPSPEAVPAPPPAATATPPASGPVAAGPIPAQLRALLQRLRREVESNCADLGPGFAEEARRIHSGEAPARAIYGDATEEQVEQLAEDGIEISRIPWVPLADS